MTKENIYYPDDNAFDRFYKRARYQANSFVAAQLGSKAADLLTTVPDFAYLICKLMLDPDVPSSRKLDLGLALLYVLSPLDLVPDSVPLLGKLDDAYAIAVSVAKLLRGTERDTGLDFEGLDELSRYYEHVRKVYKSNESGMVSPNAQIYKYEIPGGQYSNLLAQVTEMGSKDEFEKIKDLYSQANHLLGNLIKVTPSSKVVGDLAIFMLKNGLNKDNILTEGASLSYPDSVIDFFKGMMGQPEGGFPAELQKIVLKDIEPITVRPGTLLPDVDFEDIKKHLREKFNMEGFSDFEMEQKAVSYALYPKVYEDYCTHFEAYNDVTTLESHVYFYGLRKGEETTLKVSEGRNILIKFVGMSDPDKDGYRVLTFEVNGILRELKVLDKTLEVLEDRKLKADKNNPCHLGSTIPGTVETVLVKEGDEVKVNQPLMIVEAMKMETTFVSKVDGKVDKLYVAPGDRVNTEDLLISFILDENEEG